MLSTNPYESPTECPGQPPPAVRLEGVALVSRGALVGTWFGALIGLFVSVPSALYLYFVMPVTIPTTAIAKLDPHSHLGGFVVESAITLPVVACIFSSIGGILWGGAAALACDQRWISHATLQTFLPRSAAACQSMAYAFGGGAHSAAIGFSVTYFGGGGGSDTFTSQVLLPLGLLVLGLLGGAVGGYYWGSIASASITGVVAIDDGVQDSSLPR